MKAPNFSLHDQNNEIHTLEDYAGKWVIVYFYPKDSTPGCTKEACNFRDGRQILEDTGTVVLGISKDSVASHKKFADAHKLNFTLLSDTSTETIQAFGAWGKKKFMGREYEGIKRNTYLINPEGEIVKVYEEVNPMTHVAEILKDLSELSA
jgi:thioredoxin-dependent peroxiredoxin